MFEYKQKYSKKYSENYDRIFRKDERRKKMKHYTKLVQIHAEVRVTAKNRKEAQKKYEEMNLLNSPGVVAYHIADIRDWEEVR